MTGSEKPIEIIKGLRYATADRFGLPLRVENLIDEDTPFEKVLALLEDSPDGTVFCSSADGFSVFTVDKKQLKMSMIDKDGKIIHTITKSK